MNSATRHRHAVAPSSASSARHLPRCPPSISRSAALTTGAIRSARAIAIDRPPGTSASSASGQPASSARSAARPAAGSQQVSVARTSWPASRGGG